MLNGRRALPAVLSVALLALTVAAACGQAKSPVKTPADTTPPTLSIDQTFVTGLTRPWDMSFLPDGTMFFTQRPGPISVRLPNGAITNLGTPADSAPSGEGGVMGIAVDANYASNSFIYVCYTTAADNRVVRFTINGDFSPGLGAPTPLVTGIAKGLIHNGCRIRIGPDSMLWITMGDAEDAPLAMNPNSLNGKILRVDTAGNPAPENPNLGGDPRIFTYGHRNPQGIAFRANGEVHSVEHGSDRDDEVNVLSPGANYGWDGNEMTCCGHTPAVWSSGFPTIAPSGATFVYGAQWRGYNGALVLAVLKGERLQIYVDRGGGLDFANPVVLPQGVRLRSVVLGRDLNLYVATDVDGGGGAIWKITPS